MLGVVAVCLLAVGAVAGFAWEVDRQLRGGLLRQRAEAAARPDWVSLRTLPPGIPRIFVATVDPGFDEREALAEIDVPDRMTLTRDLVRQVHLLDRGLPAAARALAMAPILEHHLSKRAILELYLNRVHFGDSGGEPVYGLFHAAREFFGKQPAELTMGETATLAGLLLPPR
ncbi:MAG: transglycosylase domain-containing protein, partial [Gemmatimonadota bacterium]|nr:transglycosylase domain-containing protein [Gemmatimonadota bacterium]